MPRLSVNNIEGRLSKILDSKDFVGPSYCSSKDTNPYNPGIYIHDYGWLRQPASNHDITGLHHSGKDVWIKSLEETGSVTLSSSEFEWRNESASNYLNSLKDVVLKQLTIKQKCDLADHRLVLSKTGMKIPSRMESDSGTSFATLLVALPSDCGEICISSTTEQDEQRTTTIREEDMFSVTMVTWLHGMTTKIDHGSGLFVALVYDMIWADTGPKPTVTAGIQKLEEIRKVLNDWETAKDPQKVPKFVITPKLLKHYSIFDPASMAHRDRAIVQLLLDACEKCDCQLYLLSVQALVDCRTAFGYNGKFGLEKQTWWSERQNAAVKIIDHKGKIFADFDHFPEVEGLVGQKWFENNDPDSEEEDEAYLTKNYRNSAILLILKSKVQAFKAKYVHRTKRLRRF